MRAALLLSAALIIGGCATNEFRYNGPITMPLPPNSRVIDAPREQVWDRLVPALGREFFVINTIERTSGIINVSYTGDPDRFLDCGLITLTQGVGQSQRTIMFTGAQAQQRYDTLSPAGVPIPVDRRMSVEGRVNLVVEAVGPRQTRVTANTRYVVTRRLTVFPLGGPPGTAEHSVSFNTGGRASFPMTGPNLPPLECAANGRLEADLIALAG